MKVALFLLIPMMLAACSKNEFSIVCEGTLDKSFVENQVIRHESTPNLTYFYRFNEDKVFKNHYEYGFLCSENTSEVIKCVIDLTLGDGSVTTINLNKKSFLVTDDILRKVPKNPILPISENFSGKCKKSELP